ncbi:PQQ-binding-like beta-propeller repeat protein [Rhodopirellula sp. SWK7]|uniref:outer membrane protein assembly factor BamB family protein n=1 Tax=Rhodopirellula sp. SWK7 TaxID=595460 RepID=UPI0002BFD016|nr:PQQ-binding-like beta-propeller repeat protein [Rhodopirellula sp. SWK7]EMI46223.1 serine/threonine protein kinase related protein [Rhodopirellula sp. SWK7]
MKIRSLSAILFIAVAVTSAFAEDNWAEHRGPSHNYHLNSPALYPTTWSVISDEHIRWRMPLPETGHSGIAAWNDKLFLTCFRELTAQDNGPKGTWVSETVGYCLDAKTGNILWSCDLPGRRPNQVNGTFTDSTTPTPVTDGQHVWFVNAGGFMACHTLEGQRVWAKEFEVRTKHSAKQFQPFLHDGKLYYAMLRDASDPERRPQTAKDYDKNSKTGWPWMHVRCIDALTGTPTAILPGGISVHSKGAIGSLTDEPVLLHARGGSHSPPEKPYGLLLSRLNPTHDLIWERPGLNFEGTHFIDDKHAYCFDRNDFYVLNLATGETIKRIRVRDTGSIIEYNETTGRYKPSIAVTKLKSPHLQTHRTNIGVGKYHFFMSGRPGFLGRIDLETEEINYLQVPIQVAVTDDAKSFSWTEFKPGDTTGSGFEVQGDKRRHGHGFGHISAATPIVVNDLIYFCTVLGTVYVVDAKAEQFDEHALVAVNDLGLPGETWTLSPFTAANGHLYQRTAREIICIGDEH